jgi:hypothetical protein
MTYESRWLPGLCFALAFTGGCSASSSGTPPGSVGASEDASTSSDASQAPPPIQDAAPAAACDAVSLAPVADAAAAACFECQATECMTEVAACSTDCACAPAYHCLEENSSAGSLNSGYSLCPDSINTLMNGNLALMNLAGCATTSCSPACFGGGGDGGDGG